MNILLLEDEKELADLATTQIEGSGHNVTNAACIADAHELLEQNLYELLIADNQVPDGSGARFAIGAKGKRPDMKVVVISGRLAMNDIEELEAHNISYYDKAQPYSEVVDDMVKKFS